MSVIDPSLESRLTEAVELQACQAPDLYFVTEDGARVPAHRSIVSMQSAVLHDVISDYPAHLTPSVQVPWISYNDMCSIVSILYTGEVWQGEDSVQLEEVFESLGMTNLKLNIDGQRTAPKNDNNEANETLNESTMEIDINDDPAETEELFESQRKKFKRGPKKKPKSSLNESIVSGSGGELTVTAMACKICPDVIFKSTTEFEKHLVEEHFSSELVEEYGNEEDKICEICEQSFESLEALGRHIGSSHSKVIPLYQEKIQKYSKAILEKYTSASDKSQCSLCKIKFRNTSLLSAHIGAVHEKYKEMLADDSKDNDLEVL